MPPHYPAENRMERDNFTIPMSPVAYYSYPRRPEYNILPSIESMFGRELGRPGGPIPPPTTPNGLSPLPHSGYSPESPTAMRATGGAPAMSQYLSDHKNDPWGAYKQGNPTSVHYPGAHSHHQTIEYQQQQLSQRSPSNNGEFPDYSRRAPSWDSEHINCNRLDRTTQPISPTTETTMDSHSNFESGTEIYSEDPGEMSEINSGMGDTQSQAGSTVSGLHMRQFSCKTCKSTFKCDSLRR